MRKGEKYIREDLIPDCFGNVAGKENCQVLTDDVCLFKKCPFYKSKEQFRRDKERYGSVGLTSAESIGRRSKPVMLINTKKIYPSAEVVVEMLGVSLSSIRLVCNGVRSDVCGLKFCYVEGGLSNE